jgi:EmrB/QacA subfamily drug resistance transporter
MSSRQRWTLLAAIIGSGLVFLDSTVVTVALPAIGQALPTPRLGVLEAQSYVYNSYLLSLSALLIVAGALGDLHGRRRLFLVGLTAFGLASLLCGAAPTMEVLILARVLKGAAGAVLVPTSLAIITAGFEGEVRGRAFGLWAGASAVTTILGPVLGGLLVDVWSWRMVFFLNLPLVAAGWWVARRHVPESRDPAAAAGVDLTGALVVAVALGGLTFGAIRGQEVGWGQATVVVSLVVGSLAALAFVPLMSPRRSAAPLVPLGLFRSRNFAVTNLATVPVYGSLYVTMYVLVLHLQGTLGYNAAAAGLATVPTVIFLALFSGRFGLLAARHGPRWFMAAGPGLMAVGALLLLRVPATGAAWQLVVERPATWLPPASYLGAALPALVVFGLGVMVVVAPLTTALMNSVPESRAGVASAVNNALSRVGPQLAIALLFVAVSAAFSAGLAERLGADASRERVAQLSPLNPPEAELSARERRAVREASGDAFRLAMLVAAGLAGVGGVVSAVGIRNPVHARPQCPVECLPGATPAVGRSGRGGGARAGSTRGRVAGVRSRRDPHRGPVAAKGAPPETPPPETPVRDASRDPPRR